MKLMFVLAAMVLCQYSYAISAATIYPGVHERTTEQKTVPLQPGKVTGLEESAPPVQGDVNGDGALNILDILEVMISIGCSESCGNADVNNDGVVSVLDLQELLQLL